VRAETCLLENTWKLDVHLIARWHRAVISVFRRRAAFMSGLSPCIWGKCREIFAKCREADIATLLKAIRSQHLGYRLLLKRAGKSRESHLCLAGWWIYARRVECGFLSGVPLRPDTACTLFLPGPSKASLVRARRAITVWLEVRVLPGPPRSPVRTDVSRSLTNRPQFAGIFAVQMRGVKISAAI
jgi:hypothetical protein